MPVKKREKNEKFRPVVVVLKEKKGVPTKVQFNGQEYALVHTNYINGNKNKFRK
ncbi:hypothetical protein [Mesobacillus sp. S13]|uniref:hypothetical protein n=1 Tax=Mesobacillus sp. S13 TaxID=2880221 RepID=UPI001CF2FF7B|nr:hypothetical protein [Mesobacillus sp. S13]